MEAWMSKLDLEKNGLDKIVEDGIERYRKGTFQFTVKDNDGNAVPDAEVKIEQTGHDFKFGCNAFMVNGFEDADKNELYENYFGDVFNQAVVPFYWRDDEPRKGEWRFEKESEPIYRRPPAEEMLEFCKRRNVSPKGHNLIWHQRSSGIPTWLLGNTEEGWPDIENRVRTIAGRYADRIPMWDVANEVDARGYHDSMPKDYAIRTFALAKELFPKCHLIANETTDTSWKNFAFETGAFYQYICRILKEGLKLDGIGLQYHLFYRKDDMINHADEVLDARKLLDVMETYGGFEKDLHISEITVPSYPEEGDYNEIQARMTETLYKIWFSGRKVDSIVWWNLIDGYAYVRPDWNEDYYGGGLLRKDFSKKPAYYAVENLIKKVWHTSAKTHTNGNGYMSFRGFYGSYKLIFVRNGHQSEATVNCNKEKQFYDITLGD